MKKYFFIFLALIAQLTLDAQKKGQARTDSLLQQIRTGHDTMRVRGMNTLATDWARSKPDTAVLLCSEALKLAKQTGYARGEADSHFALGQVYGINQKVNESLSNYKTALSIYEAINKPQWVGEASYAIGVIYQKTSLQDALVMFKKALNAARQQPDKNLVGKIAFNTVNTYLRMGDYNENPVYYNDIALKAYTESGNLVGQANCYIASSRINQHNGNSKQAIKDNYFALNIYEKAPKSQFSLVGIYNVHTGLGLIYEDQKNYTEALASYEAAQKAANEMGNKDVQSGAYANMGNVYRELGRRDEALKAFETSLKLSEEVANKKYIATAKGNIATLYGETGREEEALKLHDEARKLFEEVGAKESVGISYYETARVLFFLKRFDESKQWLQKSVDISSELKTREMLKKSYELMMQVDTSTKDYVSAFDNYKKFISYRDSISNAEVSRQLIEQKLEYAYTKKEDSLRLEQALLSEQLEKQTLLTRQQQQELKLKQASLELAKREKDLQMFKFLKTQADLQLSNSQKEKELAVAEQDRAQKQSQIDKQKLLASQSEQALLVKDKKLATQKAQRNILLAGAIGLLLLSFFVFINNRNQRKANRKLREQQAKTELALKELKAAQAQLIQSAKMASLGELTAGIAHEIQNPLNFVNNFSELNDDLMDEMKQELEAGHYEDALEIATSIRENNSKVAHHGKRADAIVKGMLQHSRASGTNKELIDINALAEEYLRLSYHGLRAKDKSFNASFTSDFDRSVGKLEVVPQDMGRVLLNLLNNAFYAVNEKRKNAKQAFEPTVSVKTSRTPGKIEISVKDNGTGIPEEALNKIYQPFFTTKPTGQGTGLGLSLSYDIIKAHGGELKVKTKEGEFAEFIIQLPEGKAN